MPSPFVSLVSSGRHWTLGLQICVSVTLAARGWLTMRWDSPIRALVWNEDWWATPLDSLFGIPWEQVALHSDGPLSIVLDVLGIVLLLTSLLVGQRPYRIRTPLSRRVSSFPR